MNQSKYLNWFPLLLFILPLMMITSKQEVYASTSTKIQIVGKLKEESIEILPGLPDKENESNNLESKETVMKGHLPSTGERSNRKMSLIGALAILMFFLMRIRFYPRKVY